MIKIGIWLADEIERDDTTIKGYLSLDNAPHLVKSWRKASYFDDVDHAAPHCKLYTWNGIQYVGMGQVAQINVVWRMITNEN